MNTGLRMKAKNDFEKDFFKLMNNVVLGKTMEYVELVKFQYVKLVRAGKRRHYLVLKPNYHTTKIFIENLLAKEIKKREILMNKLVHLGLSVLELSKILMYDFWYDYVKPK